MPTSLKKKPSGVSKVSKIKDCRRWGGLGYYGALLFWQAVLLFKDSAGKG